MRRPSVVVAGPNVARQRLIAAMQHLGIEVVALPPRLALIGIVPMRRLRIGENPG